MEYYKISDNHKWNTDPICKDMIGVVFKVGGKRVKITWYNRNKDIWSYFVESEKDKTDLMFWTGKVGECSFSECSKKEAEEMLGYKI